ncbi:hypothetical protein JAAARDRAFT_42799 [Jaapia argillacea MUCL 33604]|uniref:Uncharacterized protein n=1 Tax=Jaapia argillacea MUCL 33604 TaxID=933084 RepID=A0A067PEV9_9AGAM|nr:hypothetical protein JAAARDRAFT_42799 [Jaapia argillacea MUCL 33604]
MSITKTMTFNWTGLSQDAFIMLCFTPPSNAQLSTEQNLVAWELIPARPGGDGGSAVVTYSGHVGFGSSELAAGNIVAGSIKIEMKGGQKVNLITDANNYTEWDTPVSDPSLGQLFKAYNKTATSRAMSVGTLNIKSDGRKDYAPTFLWTTVGPNLFVEAKFQPVLKAYVNLGYKKNEFITADISGDSIWSQDLSGLPDQSSFDFIETPEHGYTIQPSAAN